MDSLQAAMRRVRAEVMQPYTSIRMQTSQLHNLHTTADTLRHVLHRLKLVSRLKVSPPTTPMIDQIKNDEPRVAGHKFQICSIVGLPGSLMHQEGLSSLCLQHSLFERLK